MAHFAQLDENNIVMRVIVVHNNELLDENGIESEDKGIAFLIAWSGGHPYWRQTSYNSNFRKNFAGADFTYDVSRDAFIPPRPFASWILNEDTCLWEPPFPAPTDGNLYKWDENTQNWELLYQ